MYFPLLGCYISKHLNINVFASVLLKFRWKWTVRSHTFHIFVFVRTSTDMWDQGNCILFYTTDWYVDGFRNVPTITITSECLFIKESYQYKLKEWNFNVKEMKLTNGTSSVQDAYNSIFWNSIITLLLQQMWLYRCDMLEGTDYRWHFLMTRYDITLKSLVLL